MIWTRRDVGRLAAGAGAIAALPSGLAPGFAWGAETTISHGVSVHTVTWPKNCYALYPKKLSLV